MRTLDLLERGVREALAAARHQGSTIVLQVDHVDALETRFTRTRRCQRGAEFRLMRLILRIFRPGFLDLEYE